MVIRFEHVPVAVHRHLEAAMAGKSLHGLGVETGVDPAGHGKMS